MKKLIGIQRCFVSAVVTWKSGDEGKTPFDELFSPRTLFRRKAVLFQTFAIVLFLTGTFMVSAQTQQTWGALGNGLNAGVFALQVLGGVPYAGGQFGTQTGCGIAQWNGTAWVDVGSNFPPQAPVYAIAGLNGNLYAGGALGSAYNIQKWDGTTWTSTSGPGLNN